jgi:nucleoside-diphosphate-sugar epimerase
MRESLDAIRALETSVVGARAISGIVLRYGGFYGPGTSISYGGEVIEMVRQRKFPVIGDGAGMWSFLHIDDAARATQSAIEAGPPGVYNIVDDDPAPVAEWLPELAQIIGAPPPRRIPVWLARILAGDAMVSMMTTIRGASIAKAKRVLSWQPRYSSWREGFRNGLAAEPSRARFLRVS